MDGRVTLVDTGNPITDHATHVAGTIGAALAGTGLNADAARGMASEVNLRSYTAANYITEMSRDAAMMVASNHSYVAIRGWRPFLTKDTVNAGTISNSDVWVGDYANSSVEDPGFGRYGSRAQALDQVLFQNPNLLSVWSAGNDRNNQFTNANGNNSYVTFFGADPTLQNFNWTRAGWYLVPTNIAPPPSSDGDGGTGYDSLPNDQVAKNTLVVGAIPDITADPYDGSDVSMSTFSSWGPTDDGRVKPDVVANGVGLLSSGASSDTAYYYGSGTSMAAPSVTGTAVLLIEHYQNLFSNLPRSATTKGLLTHTATDAGTLGPDYQFGWGVVDAARAADFLSQSSLPNTNHLLGERTYDGTEQVISVNSDGTEPLKVSIAWTDPAGSTQSNGLDDRTPVLVNNLNIRIVGPDGNTYYPWTLNPDEPSSPANQSTPNNIDNVEQVFLETPASGTYQIYVDHSGDDFTQDFSLFVSGASRVPKIDLVANDPISSEDGDLGSFVMTRIGDTSSTLDVNYSITGSAGNGVDYSLLPGTATFLPGEASVVVTVDPIDDAVIESDETVMIALESDSGYQLGADTSDTVTIADNDVLPLPLVDLSGSYFNVSPYGLNTGELFTANFSIANSQINRSGSFDVDFYISDNTNISTSDHYLGSYTVSGVPGNGSTRTLTKSLRLPDWEDPFWDSNVNGTKFNIGMIIDANNDVKETNETNNRNTGIRNSYDDVSVNKILVGAYSWTGKLDDFIQQISNRWNQGYDLIDVERGDGRWFGVFQDTDASSTTLGPNGWAYTSKLDNFIQEIQYKWNEGLDLIDVERGDGRWFGVFGPDNGPNAWAQASKLDDFIQEIQYKRNEGLDLIDVEHGDGKWFGVFGPGNGRNTWSWATNFDHFTRQISDRWDQGYELVDVAQGDGRWFGVFQD